MWKQQYAGLKPVTFRYDFGGRRVESITGEQRTESMSYDALGNIRSVTDGNANTTAYEYDTWGRITGIKRADGSSESYAYDYAGNVIASVDGNGNAVHYTYNEINKLAQITWQDATTEAYAYDISGNLSKVTLQDGRSITYTYNMYRNLTARRGGGAVEEHYLYEADGKLKSAIAGGMRYDYIYYPDGSLKEKRASGRTLISYEYDLNGNIIKETDVSGKTTSYEYDAYNRTSRVYDNARLLAEYNYTAFGMKQRISLPGIAETRYGYDGDANLMSHKVQSTEGILEDTRYQYDGNGNILSKAGIYGTHVYTYDNGNRLTGECFTGAPGTGIVPESYNISHSYDNAGNRIRMEAGGILHEYAYDSCNRLISEQTGEVKRNFTYDTCGNLLHDGSATYTYDELNRLSVITTGDGHIQKNRYDAEGLRHEIEEDGRLVQFIYNGRREVIAEESKEAGIIRYIRGLGLVSSDSEEAKTYYHYLSDELGSVTHILEGGKKSDAELQRTSGGKVLNRYIYDAFGNTIAYEEKVSNRFRYSCEQYDRLSGQYYLRSRYYNPVIGRFTQQDTYLGAGLNLYAYCGNNPLCYVDPSGHNPESAAGRMTAEEIAIELQYEKYQGIQDSYSNAEKVYIDKCVAAENKFVDTGAQAWVNNVFGDTSQTSTAGAIPGTIVPDAPQTTAIVPVAPMGTYQIVPYNNTGNNNPLSTRQTTDVKDAVRDAGGTGGAGSGHESGRETELFLPDEYYQKLDDNIANAIAARDAEVARIQGLSKTQQSNIATVVAGVDIRTGEVYVGVKNSRTYKGNATCAEDIVFRGLGGNTNANIIMTPAIRPRNNEVIPVCTRCQTKYPQNQFVKGTTFQ